jgi:hypothetical protein
MFAGVGDAPEPGHGRGKAPGAKGADLVAVQRRLDDAYRAGAPAPPEDRPAIRRHPSVWILAFEEHRAGEGGGPDDFDAAMLRDLLESRRIASSNGILFSAYLLLAAALAGVGWLAIRLGAKPASPQAGPGSPPR